MKRMLLILAIVFPLNSFAYDVEGYLKDANKARIVFNVVAKSRDTLVPALNPTQTQHLAEECARETLAQFTTSEMLTNRIKVSRTLLVACNKAWTKRDYFVAQIVITDIRTDR